MYEQDLRDIRIFVAAGANINGKCTKGIWEGYIPLELACYDYKHLCNNLANYSNLAVEYENLKESYRNRIKLLIELGAEVTEVLKHI